MKKNVMNALLKQNARMDFYTPNQVKNKIKYIMLIFIGYWRKNKYSLNIYKCYPLSENCLSERENSNLCKPMYCGSLCQTCSKGYARYSGNSVCQKCYSVNTNYLIIGFLSFIMIFFLFLFIKFYE